MVHVLQVLRIVDQGLKPSRKTCGTVSAPHGVEQTDEASVVDIPDVADLNLVAFFLRLGLPEGFAKTQAAKLVCVYERSERVRHFVEGGVVVTLRDSDASEMW